MAVETTKQRRLACAGENEKEFVSRDGGAVWLVRQPGCSFSVNIYGMVDRAIISNSQQNACDQ